MKHVLIVLIVLAIAVPMAGMAFAEGGFDTERRNLQSAVNNVSDTGGDMIQSIGQETAKGTNPAEHLTGVAMGGIVGVRKGIHRLGAGAIDLLTFWIPKNAPLVAESTFE